MLREIGGSHPMNTSEEAIDQILLKVLHNGMNHADYEGEPPYSDDDAMSVKDANAALTALFKKGQVEAQINTEHYWIRYYGEQRKIYDGGDGDMPEINELKRHQQLHKYRLAILQASLKEEK